MIGIPPIGEITYRAIGVLYARQGTIRVIRSTLTDPVIVADEQLEVRSLSKPFIRGCLLSLAGTE